MRLTGDGSPYPSDTCAKKVGRSVPLSRSLNLVPFESDPAPRPPVRPCRLSAASGEHLISFMSPSSSYLLPHPHTAPRTRLSVSRKRRIAPSSGNTASEHSPAPLCVSITS